jgi:CPA2 family monovalent cation:H+ antiporter-2
VAEATAALLDLGVLAVSALLMSLLFVRLKLPIVSAQIVAGMLVGPSVLGWVKQSAFIDGLASVGIVLLLFVIGLELDPVELGRIARRVVFLTLLEVVIAFAIALNASYLLHLNPLQSVVLAMAASISSTAIVGKVFLERRMLQADESKLLISVLVMEDIVAIVFLIILSSLTAPGSAYPLDQGLSITRTILGGAALLGTAYATARYFAPRAINYLSHYEEEFEEISFLFALGLGFLFGVLGAYLGYSPAIGAFVIGLSIRGKHSKFLSSKVRTIKDLFLALFFVSMGSLIDPFPALILGLPVLTALGLMIVGKFLGGFTVGRVLAISSPQMSLSSASLGARLIPRGEFSFVIGQFALAVGLIDLNFFSLIGLAVLITAIVGPLLQLLTDARMAPSAHPIRANRDE